MFVKKGSLPEFAWTSIICVNDLCELECASQLYDVLESNPDAKVKLTSYAIKGYIIVLVPITVIDAGNKGGSVRLLFYGNGSGDYLCKIGCVVCSFFESGMDDGFLAGGFDKR